MAALALLSYTEFAGRLKNNDFSDQNSRKNFDDFFKDLGASYRQFLSQHNAYKIFRSGLAHEYYVKEDCIIGCGHIRRRQLELDLMANNTFSSSNPIFGTSRTLLTLCAKH